MNRVRGVPQIGDAGVNDASSINAESSFFICFLRTMARQEGRPVKAESAIQAFSPVRVMPSINCFWARRKRTRIGSAAITAPAISTDQFASP